MSRKPGLAGDVGEIPRVEILLVAPTEAPKRALAERPVVDHAENDDEPFLGDNEQATVRGDAGPSVVARDLGHRRGRDARAAAAGIPL